MWESSRKMLGPDISILEDDNLEGSKDELLISQEVFYDNVPAHKLEHYLDDGIENPEIKQRKVFQASFCSKIGKSFLRNEAAYEDSSIYDADDLSGLYQKTSESSCFTEGSTQIESNDHLAPAKRIKLSVDDLYNFKPFLDKSLAKSVPLKDIISGMHQPASTSGSRIFMCHVVESTGNGITSSCYLLNNDIEKDKGGNSVVGDAVTCNLSTSGAIGGKGMGSEAIPSLVSQESIASKDLVSPAATASKEFGPPKCTNKKIKRGISVELDAIDVLLRSDCAQDSRLLLRNQIFHLLVDAGWSIEKRQRKCRSHAEFLYVSPQEKPFRELTKAWIFFGKNLLVQESVQMPAKYDMQWSDFGRFWSDLSNTLKHIEIEIKDREHKGSLAHRWTLLDPFVNVVFVERKLKALKAGNVVKANCSLAAADKKSAFTFGLKQSNGKTGRHASKKFPDYFMGPEGVLIDFGEQPGAGAVEGSTSKSIYVSEGDSMHHMQTASTNEKHYDVCLNGSSHLHPSSFPTFRSSITSIQSASSLYEVPISRANADVMCEGKTFSPHENNCRSSPSRNRKNSESGMDVAEYVAVGSFSGGVEPSKRRVCDQREQLLVSMNDCLNHVDVALLQSSELNKFLHESETMLPEVVLSEMIQQSRVRTEELMENGVHSTANANVKKKMHKRSKSASAIKVVQHEYPHMPSYRVRTGIKELIPQSSQLRSAAFQECFTDDAQNPDSCRDVLTVSFQRPIGQRKSECPSLLHGGDHDSDCLKDVHPRNHTDEISGGVCVGLSASKSDMINTSRGRSIACRLKDDDLLISAIIQSSGGKQSKPRAGTTKSKCFKKRKIRKGRCRLLPRSLGKGGKHFADDRWTSMFERTVLSWLINAGVISVNEVIQYQDLKNNEVVKDGVLARNGVLCKCCSKVFSLSNFKMHAGFDLKRPCLNLFMESSKPFTLCQLQAWSAEYKARKSSTRTAQINEFDQNDDSCGLCGEGGELLCCDNCPSTFHQSCLLAEELPEGSWYCSNCTCWICGNLVSDEGVFTSNGSLKCSQCDHKYHEVCLRYNGANEIGSSPWFCSKGCEQVYSGLQSCVGLPNFLSDEFSWTLLKSIHDDAKNHSAQRLALKAECNSKLAVALTIMEECFLSMVDPRTGIDMIPHVVYNWGSTFARLNYQRFYTAVLEKNDVLMCVASIRVHGTALAEMPLIATCSKYRRQGLCRCLLSAIEKLLIAIKVEKLVIAALPELVETWTVGFGFIPMGEDEKKSLNKVNLMVLPGTVMLKKPLYIDQASDLSEGSANELSCKSYKSVEEGPTLVGNRCRELKCENEESCFIKEDAGDFKLQAIYCRASEAVEDQKMKADVLQLTPSSCLGSQG